MHAWLQLYVGIQSTMHPHIYVHQTKLSFSPLTEYYCWNWQFKPKFLPNEKLLHFVFISSKSSNCIINMACSLLHCTCNIKDQQHRHELQSSQGPLGPKYCEECRVGFDQRKSKCNIMSMVTVLSLLSFFSFRLLMNRSFSWPCKSKI